MTIHDIKSWYKESPLWLIPEDWNIVTIKDISEYSTSSLSMNDLLDNEWDFPLYWASWFIKKIDFYEKSENYIGIVKDWAWIWRVMLWSPQTSVLWTMAYITNKDNANLCYLYFLLANINYGKFVTWGAIPHVYFKDYWSTRIMLPPLQEQEAISKILLKIDEVINITQEVIKKLELRNKWLDQKLLTWKVRLKWFNKDRVGKKIGDEITFYWKKSTVNDEYEVLTSSKAGLVTQKEYYGDNRLVARENIWFNIIPSWYITYRSRSDDWKFTFNINKYEFTWIVSKYYPVFTCKTWSNEFLVKYLNLFASKIGSFSIWTSQLVLWTKELCDIYLDFPEPEEQKAIVNILNESINQLDWYKGKLEKLQELKKWLMQQLLTWKVRVKEFRN